MVKTGVVGGVVKTASADNENDPIGTAAKCIADAGEAAASLNSTVKELKKDPKGSEDQNKKES